MKITSLILFLALMQASAAVYSQKITYKNDKASLSQIFTEINKQTGYNVFWSQKSVKNLPPVKVDFNNVSLEQVLISVLRGTSLDYAINDKSVVIKTRSIAKSIVEVPPPAADITVTGSVKNAKGESLPGSSITVEGNNRLGTVTDNNGNFVITVKDGAVIHISSIGYLPQTFTVSADNKVFKVVLQDDVKHAEEVVVTAYGKKQRKEAVVGSVTTVKPAELKIPASNLTTALAGQVAGVIAFQPTGQPGQDNAQFFIRGVTTFGYKVDPLILIDNIELSTNDLARLNVDDIASFSILKDASATALYGARGANGVILVNTKEGKIGKLDINVRLENSVSQNTQSLQLADPITYMNLFNEATTTRDPTQALPFNQDKINNTLNTINRGPGYNPYVYPAVDWLKTLLKKRTGTQRGNMSISGGNPLARYYVAGSYNIDHGNLVDNPDNNNSDNIKFQNYQLRSNVNLNITKTTEVILRFSGTFSSYAGPLTTDGTFNSDIYNLALHTSPVLFPAYFPADSANQGTKHILFGAPPGTYNSVPFNNPYALLLRGHKTSSESRVLAQVEINQKLDFLTKGLNFHGLFETNRYSYFDSNLAYKPFYYNVSSYDRASNNYTLNWLNQNPGDAIEYLQYFPGTPIINTSNYLQGNLDYAKQLGNHNISATLVGTMQQTVYSNASQLVDALPHRNEGLAGRLAYNYKGKYFTEFNFGYNGSERFSEEHRYGFFPTIGAGWLLSEENFFRPLTNIFDRVKLRASYGLVGNDAISDRRFFYSSNVNLAGGGGAEFGTNRGYSHPGVQILNYPDPNVTWETSKQMNLALEITTLKNLNITAEYYNYNRYNILQQRSYIPTTSGLEAPIYANLGKANSKGIDLSADYKQQFGKDWLVSGRGNLTLATDKYTYYEEPDYPEPWRRMTGQPIRAGYGFIAERLFVDDAEAQSSPTQIFTSTGKAPRGGDIKYRDLNGDGVIDQRDETFIGYPQVPEIVYGYGFSAQYKNFDLSAFFQGQARVSFFIDPNKVSPFVQSNQQYIYGNTQLLKQFADSHWSEQNQNIYAMYPRLGVNSNDIQNNLQPSTWWLRDGSFMRLKSAEFGYTIPPLLTKRLGLKKCRIYFNGLNLITWSSFKLWDPELGGNGFAYPIQKVYNIGLNVNL
ncbi:TonB-dependent receptor [Mucilaginibacter pocheonensis]|uniref:TonB-linked SusC/RagA family outer membrane protein n=1 Tax=Mucilaginibacter pocheonensis TaxID=398050 RepID=A0ABU1TEB4_9SPHI|nr:TonB-dependent receptor [Mucilaginibacter pocheonensis]MDR6943749.1 TonB-linked SusC/RagA family outer membrane protein [Mucilaginibacter pocheonensis]